MILVSKRMGKKVWVAVRQERMTECEIEKLRRSQVISGFCRIWSLNCLPGQ